MRCGTDEPYDPTERLGPWISADLGVGFGLGRNLGLDVGLGLDLRTGVGLGLDLRTDVGFGSVRDRCRVRVST